MKRKIEKELVGKIIKAVELDNADSANPAITLEFTDGTSFSVLGGSKTTLDATLFFSEKDGDEITEELGE